MEALKTGVKLAAAPVREATRAARKLSLHTMSAEVLQSEYAVLGRVPKMAGEIKEQLLRGTGSFAFDRVRELNIGNPQIFCPKTVSLAREFVAGVFADQDAKPNEAHGLTPSGMRQVFQAGQAYRKQFHVQSISPVCGFSFVRESVAKFIENRDKLPSNPEDIVLTIGASTGIHSIMSYILSDKDSGIMLPIPQYPLFSASTALCGGHLVPYYLDEEADWNVDLKSVQEELDRARSQGIKTKAIVLINPGNPTGSIFDEKTIRDVLVFAHKNNLLVMADEVYQENVYSKKWVSFKSVLASMPPEIRDNLELISFHSISKGIFGECGFRGGYFEMVNIDPHIKTHLKNYENCNRPNTAAQIILDIKCRLLSTNFENIPGVGELMSTAQREYSGIFESFKRKAHMFDEVMLSTPGIKSNPIEGAMYGFPRLMLPQKFLDEAQRRGLTPDVMYCIDMLEKKGICVVPGSGFGQKPGTHHFRTTILISPDHEFELILQRFKEFQIEVLEKYS